MRYFLFLSICLFIVVSCSAPKQAEPSPPMIDAAQLAKYNMTIDFRDKHFSGLLLVKQTETNTYRTVFSTHFGLSLFDLEISPETYIVHHCVEPLQRRRLLKLLHRDFSVLLGLRPETLETGRGLGKTYYRRLPVENLSGKSKIQIDHSRIQLMIELEPLE